MKQDRETLLICALVGLAAGAAIGLATSRRNRATGTIVGASLGLAAGLAGAYMINKARKSIAEANVRDQFQSREYNPFN